MSKSKSEFGKRIDVLLNFIKEEGRTIDEFKDANELCEWMGFPVNNDDFKFVREFWTDIVKIGTRK